MAGLPWFKFYPSDWRSDPLLRSCTAAERGVLIELLCLMHEAEPYGHLLLNGQRPSNAALSSVCSLDVRLMSSACRSLVAKGVLSETAGGVLFSRRMVKKARESAEGKANGAKGGNPLLLTGGLTPRDKTQKPEARSEKPEAITAIPKTAFVGQRFKVWTWQHEDLVRALGSIPFDLLAWYPKLDAEMTKSGEPIADEAKWLRERLYTAAGIQRPNLFGRTPEIAGRVNVPSAAETARKAAERAAIPFNRRKY